MIYDILLGIFAIFCIALLLFRFYFREKVFAYFLQEYMDKLYTPVSDKAKKEHFKSLSQIQSKDHELRKVNAIKILEIGPGTDGNSKYYPKGSRLTIVDSNPHTRVYYEKNKKKHHHIHSHKIITAKGEDMHMIKSDSFDVVVMTHVMCSVDQIPDLLAEIRRVLFIDGKFYFYEHVREFDSKKHYVRQWIQDILTWSGVWSFVFVGCKLNKTLVKELEKAKFHTLVKKHVHLCDPTWLLKCIQPHLIGVATK